MPEVLESTVSERINRVPITQDVLDVQDFNERVVGAYNDGTAELELPADHHTLRSFIPAGTGVLRDFSKNARDLRQAYDISRKRRSKLPGLLCLAKSKEIAVQRLADMDKVFAQFEADSFGCF